MKERMQFNMKNTIKENLKYMASHKKQVAAFVGVMSAYSIAIMAIGVVGLGVIFK